MAKHPSLIRLGEAVLLRRRRLGLSQEELGVRAGLHRNHIGGIERGEINLSYLNLVNLAQALGSKTSDLIAGAEA